MDTRIEITRLKINGMENPLGIDHKYPVFQYEVASQDNEKIIEYTQLIVENSEGRVVFDTQKSPYNHRPYIYYTGEALVAKASYKVQMRVWDESGYVTDYCQPVTFEMGFLDQAWEAKWIEPIQEEAIREKTLPFHQLFIPNPKFYGGERRLKPCQNLRRSFICHKGLVKARIYASAHGVYQLFLNEQKVGHRRLAPETSVYKSMLYYQTYDVTQYLLEGDNQLDVILGDGWWIGRLGITGESCNYGTKLQYIGQIELTYEDGHREIIGSDEAYMSSESMIRYSDLFIGEKVDYTFKSDQWLNCQEIELARDNLLGQPIDAIRTLATLDPVKITGINHESFVVDFGQVIAGICHCEIEATEGQIITFEHSEVLDPDGNYRNNIIGRNKDQKDVLVCREGHQIFEPLFTYHGFRYVKVTGVRSDQMVIKALVIGSPLSKKGQFECSHEGLNQLQRNIEWSTVANMVSVPTDCPQREKLGWTGDIGFFARTGMFNYDMKNFLETWLMNMRLDQHEDGAVPVTVPNHPYQDKTQKILSGGSITSSGWGDACISLPYDHYMAYGDMTVLKDHYPAMKKWLAYIQKEAAIQPDDYGSYTEERKKRNPYLWTKGYHFGDWLIPSLREKPDGVALGTKETAAVVGACFYAISVANFIKVCEVLGNTAEVVVYGQLLEKIRWAIREEFVGNDGTVHQSNLQGLYVMILKSEAVEGPLREKVLKKLIRLIADNEGCLDTGFSSVSYLLDVLSYNGARDEAYKLLYQKKAPSWLYMVDQGATTIWENWMAIRPDGTVTDSSYNHYAFGSVGDWIYRHIAGIRPIAAGYEKVLICPDFDSGLTHCRCGHETPYGPLNVNWANRDGKKVLKVEIPIGIQARISFDGDEEEVGSGNYEYVKVSVGKQ